jgi:glycosyltransferase involved in cell wall biosynthesis
MQTQLGLNNIYFLGRVPQQDAPRLYPGCDLLVLPSFYEPFGNVVLEALASGLPVVGSKIGGMADVVTDGETGFHVKPGNTQDLSKYMQLLLKDEELRKAMGAAARKHAIERFDDMIVTKKVERLYYQCLKR